ncbi:50S ribosomal protein L19e [Caldivirga maquilingensis]|uniref:Large ribosomal subunit protein eL19 n=1 Tax=Caldivirga maquilingensis (strain ATCC 700844 / DSM 13496 / JCM 10307 / IC-167) TaxID=397948 RepID=A8M9I4_CALMQ|nr:50S ribosomal protein L19e [Caldivirga maquilingensis]ABW00865.1 Ribosomal protein L19e [Caldivirga maquilingensis IC-167]
MDLRETVARLLNVPKSRIVIKQEALEQLEEAITRNDVRSLMKEGLIEVKPRKRNSRGRWRITHEKRKSGRRRGRGSRRGTRKARGAVGKEVWVPRIRRIRRFLNTLKHRGVIDKATWRNLYRMAKGGYFESLAHLRTYMIQNGIVTEDKIKAAFKGGS